ncbi:hypothetical protein Tco_0291773 [Tanacetum coccineum]
MASLDRRLNPLYAIKECSSCGNLHTKDCGCSKGSLEDKILVPIPDLSQRPLKIENFCLDCGDPVHGLYCRQCALIRKTLEEVFQDFQGTFKSSDDDTNFVNQEPFVVKQGPGSCRKGAHYGYNCPPQILIISNPEPCYNQNLNEILQNLQGLQQQCLFGTCQQCGCNEYDGVCFYCTVGNGTPITFSTPYSSNDSPSFANHPPQNFQSFPQQYSCCEDCGGPHETFQCQPMNEDDYHEQNSCYNSNSFGFDQVQSPQYTVNHPISNVQNSLFNAQNEFLNSQNELLNSSNKLMEQMTTLCDLVGQAIQKKEEEKRIAEEQAAKDRYWKIPICYDDDDDYTIAITPVLSTEEPVNSLSMGDEHLDTIPATESDEFIKSSVEDLVPIPSESEGIPDKMCDVPLCKNTTPLNALNEHSEIVVNSNNDNSSSDDDSTYGEDIDYVDASPPDVEIVSLEVVEIIVPEVGRIDDDILLTIKDDIIREKLLNVNLLIAKIDALRDNPTPSSDIKSSGSTTTHVDFSRYNSFIFDLSNDQFPPADRSDLHHEEFADELAHIMSLPNLECFKFKIEPDPGDLTSIDLGIRKNVSTTNVNVPLEDDQSSLFAYVDFPVCEDSRACSIHMSFTSSASFWESSIQI